MPRKTTFRRLAAAPDDAPQPRRVDHKLDLDAAVAADKALLALQAPAANGACSGKVGTVVNKCTGPCTAGERRAYSGIFARRLQPFTAVCVVCRAELECPMQFCTAAQPRGVGQAVD